jgi:hypothetical protein
MYSAVNSSCRASGSEDIVVKQVAGSDFARTYSSERLVTFRGSHCVIAHEIELFTIDSVF